MPIVMRFVLVGNQPVILILVYIHGLDWTSDVGQTRTNCS